MNTIKMAAKHASKLTASYPWTKSPVVVGAPMRSFAGPALAVAISRAGGLGFIGPGPKTENTLQDLETATELLEKPSFDSPKRGATLPVGVGFIVWLADLAVAGPGIEKHRPAAVWLFAPRGGQQELDQWTAKIKEVSPETEVWIQVGTLAEALSAATSPSPPDVLVLQGAEAGGHGRAEDAVGITVLLPEVADALRAAGKGDIPLVAAGGIADGRGAASAFALGAAAVTMGTRFLASTEARVPKGYQDEVVRASDGATSTVRTQLYNHLRGMFDWPSQWSPRGLWNASWVDHQAGVAFEELKRRHDEVEKEGDKAWGKQTGRVATYAGSAVGLVKEVKGAEEIVLELRKEVAEVVEGLAEILG
jgi:nitronate monooxygenase